MTTIQTSIENTEITKVNKQMIVEGRLHHDVGRNRKENQKMA